MKHLFILLSLSVFTFNTAIASDGISYASCDLKILGNKVIPEFKNLETPKMTLNFELSGKINGGVQLKKISNIELGLNENLVSVKLFDDESEIQKIKEQNSNWNLKTFGAGGVKYVAENFGSNGDEITFILSGKEENKVNIKLPNDDNKEYILELPNSNKKLSKQLIIKCKNANNGIFTDKNGKQPESIKYVRSDSSSAKKQ